MNRMELKIWIFLYKFYGFGEKKIRMKEKRFNFFTFWQVLLPCPALAVSSQRTTAPQAITNRATMNDFIFQIDQSKDILISNNFLA